MRAEVQFFCLQVVPSEIFIIFSVDKKEYNISATNKYCGGSKHFGFKVALRLAPKRY